MRNWLSSFLLYLHIWSLPLCVIPLPSLRPPFPHADAFLIPPGLWPTTRGCQSSHPFSSCPCESPPHPSHSPWPTPSPLHQCRYHPRPLRLQHLVLGCSHVGTFTTLLGLDFSYWIIPSRRSLAHLFCSDTLFWVAKFSPVSLWCRLYLALPHLIKFEKIIQEGGRVNF